VGLVLVYYGMVREEHSEVAEEGGSGGKLEKTA
jgi:hypothetical protein